LRRAAYVVVTLILAAAGSAAAIVGGQPAPPVIVGIGLAWAVQAASFWWLAGGLGAGQLVTGLWIVGISARLGTGVVLWALAALAGVPARTLMMGYGLALVAFLLLEAGWLAVVTAGARGRRG
jgi:hypothetical protein